MRLTCPNCGAQYEVPDEVIPESGRDVQCSNCGDTWFQHHPDHAPDPEEAPSEEPSWDAPSEAEEVEEVQAEPAPEPEREEDTEDEDSEEQGEETPEPDGPTRKELDPEVADVLREEAERERAARAAEGSESLETQPELGLNEGADEADRRAKEAQARMARLRGEPEADPDEDDGPDPGTRRNLLPDIDEINSSLSSDSTDPGMVEPHDTHDAATARQSGGFRRGFLTMVLLAVIGLLLYVFAPQLAAAVPALEGALAAYVEMVNGLRGWLDQLIGGLMGAADGTSNEGG
ncbi:zinc-ribbon domain-containing protein [Roseovarius sp. 2305UL8-3]|uniref:zinc-ribbon domain-containing protein n=1 Tax=Roseovarius conchicola TaxID=3121636 RepID=UPI003529AF99